MTGGLLGRWLQHPLTRDLALDDPRTTSRRRLIIEQKPFLGRVYAEWYARILGELGGRAAVLEIGSGAGFFAQLLPSAISSERFWIPGVAVVADAERLPFARGALDAIVMTDVLHHLPDPAAFFREAGRCVRPGGRTVMIEPWRTGWSEFVYGRFHHEPFQPRAGWRIPPSGPLSGANGALPWILFERDRALFERTFPEWRVARIETMMPLAYLASGGVSLRYSLPPWCYGAVRWLERHLFERAWSMFALIALDRI